MSVDTNSKEFNSSKELGSLKDLKSLKVCYWFTNVAYYLSFVSLFFVCAVVVFNFTTGKNIKYMHLPVTVTYENIEGDLPLDQRSSDNYIPVVGYQNLKLDISEFELITHNMWIPFILILGLIYLLYQFRLFLRTVRENSPFAPENPKRLKLIGYIVTLAGPIVGILNYMYAKVYIHYIKLPGATIDVENEIYPFAIFLGLMILVVAHVLEIAIKMKIEQDLTV